MGAFEKLSAQLKKTTSTDISKDFICFVRNTSGIIYENALMSFSNFFTLIGNAFVAKETGKSLVLDTEIAKIHTQNTDKSIIDTDGDTWIKVEETADIDKVVIKANQTTGVIFELRKNDNAMVIDVNALGEFRSVKKLSSYNNGAPNSIDLVYDAFTLRADVYRYFDVYGFGYPRLLRLDGPANSMILNPTQLLRVNNIRSSGVNDYDLIIERTSEISSGNTISKDIVIYGGECSSNATLYDKIAGNIRIKGGKSLAGNSCTGGSVYIDAGIAANGVTSNIQGKVLIATENNSFVGIGNAIPSEKLDITGNVKLSGLVKMTGITEVARDLLTAVAGDIVYNTTTNKHQGFNGTIWNDLY